MTTSSTRRVIALLLASTVTGCALRSTPVQHETQGDHKSYVLPIVEILAMDAALNLAARRLYEPKDFEVSSASIRSNLRGPWAVDNDAFTINQFMHPYQGAMYHDIARSNGLNYWTSAVYTFAGSALWEIAGETTPPSRNDQIASGIAGSFLGEPLFRISRMLLDRAEGRAGVWRTVAAVLASPPAGINHMMVGDPSGSRVRDEDALPFSDIRIQLGVSRTIAGVPDTVSSLELNQPRLALSMDHGYPGNSRYRHERPFDYFRIETSVSRDGLDHLATRGLLAGMDYGGGRVDGVWGLYGSYDYFAPAGFRFSSTALSAGTTLQIRMSESLIAQTTALIGGGYVAAYSPERTEPGDHYGAAPQAAGNLRVIAGRRAAVDLTAREYFVSSVGGFGTGQRDFIFVGDASLAVRLFHNHALGLSYQLASRRSDFFDLPDRSRERSTVGLFYTYLGSGGFGAVPARRQ